MDNTKVIVVTGPTNCGKTTILRNLSEYLQSKLGYALISHVENGNPENDFWNLLQSSDKKLVFISSIGDYLEYALWHHQLCICNVFDWIVCACNDKFVERLKSKIPQAQYVEKDKNKEFYDEQDLKELVKSLLELY